jgi:hypothetical protein
MKLQTKYVHLRYHQLDESIHNMGGVTIAYRIDDANKQVQWTYVVCSEKDNFCRFTGRHMAEDKFGEGEYYLYNFDLFDVKVFLSHAKRKVYQHFEDAWFRHDLYDALEEMDYQFTTKQDTELHRLGHHVDEYLY